MKLIALLSLALISCGPAFGDTMPATYNGNAGGVSLNAGVSITEPVDADAPNAASVNTPLSKLADYCEALRTRSLMGSKTAPAMSNSWTTGAAAYGSGNGSTLRYWQDINSGEFHIEGWVKHATPTQGQVISATATGGFGSVDRVFTCGTSDTTVAGVLIGFDHSGNLTYLSATRGSALSIFIDISFDPSNQ